MPSAIVVGAGVGGLAVAGAPARTGRQVTLVERAERLRPNGAAVLLWPNGLRALGSLGLDAGLDAIATPVERAGIRRPGGGWLRHTAPGAAAGQPYVVHGEDLHDLLVAGLSDKLDIRTGVAARTASLDGDRPTVD